MFPQILATPNITKPHQMIIMLQFYWILIHGPLAKNVSKQQNSQQTPSELASGFSVKVVCCEGTRRTVFVSSCQRLQPQTPEENKESSRKPHGNVFENLIEAVC